MGLDRPRAELLRRCPRFLEGWSIEKTGRSHFGAVQFRLKHDKTPLFRLRELIYRKHSQGEVREECTGWGEGHVCTSAALGSGRTHSSRAVYLTAGLEPPAVVVCVMANKVLRGSPHSKKTQGNPDSGTTSPIPVYHSHAPRISQPYTARSEGAPCPGGSDRFGTLVHTLSFETSLISSRWPQMLRQAYRPPPAHKHVFFPFSLVSILMMHI